jgi:hypothetical protein
MPRRRPGARGGKAMTIREAIDNADELKPNAFSDAAKMRWLSELDGRIAANVFLLGVPDIRYSYADPSTALLVDAPHDGMYVQYLCAMADMSNGDYDQYQNTYAAYNALYNDFVVWFIDKYRPAQGHYNREYGGSGGGSDDQ